MFYTFVVFFSITYLIEHDRTAHHVALHELDQVWNNHSKVQVMGSGELGLVNPVCFNSYTECGVRLCQCVVYRSG